MANQKHNKEINFLEVKPLTDTKDKEKKIKQCVLFAVPVILAVVMIAVISTVVLKTVKLKSDTAKIAKAMEQSANVEQEAELEKVQEQLSKANDYLKEVDELVMQTKQYPELNKSVFQTVIKLSQNKVSIRDW